MRLLEGILILFAVVSFIGWLISGWHISLKLALTLSTLVVGLAQYLIEGYRVPLLPVYTLTVGMLIYGLWRTWQGKRQQASKPKRRLWLTILSVLYILVTVALPILLPVFQLEKPTGLYAVGTTTHAWNYEDTQGKSKLVVQFWYPAERTGAGQTAPYATPETLQVASEQAGTPAWLVDSLRLVRTNARSV